MLFCTHLIHGRWNVSYEQENGKVLIHCQSGVSRSPAVAAAYLMRSGGHTATEALQLIKDKHPAAAPNDGFLAQLGLFQDMKCSLDLEHPVYRLFCHEQASSCGWVTVTTEVSQGVVPCVCLPP